MFNKKRGRPQNRIETLIGAGTVIEGDIVFDGGLRIDGRVNGSVKAVSGKSSTLILSEQGRICGDVSADHLYINGKVNGTVTSDAYLELHASAHVCGDVHYRMLEIQVGGILEGRLVHSDAAESEKVLAFKTGSTQ